MTALVEVLEGYCRVYEDLLSLARQKQDILLGGRPQDLEPVVRAEELLLARLGQLDSELEAAGRALAGKPGDAGTLPGREDVLAGLDEDQRRQVEEVSTRLRSVLEELRRVVDENVSLLRGALQFVQFSISVLERGAAGVTYGAQGRLAQGRSPVVDRRA
ncbi:MAG: flagellar protein FlgN [Thermaerobacter sp.]